MSVSPMKERARPARCGRKGTGRAAPRSSCRPRVDELLVLCHALQVGRARSAPCSVRNCPALRWSSGSSQETVTSRSPLAPDASAPAGPAAASPPGRERTRWPRNPPAGRCPCAKRRAARSTFSSSGRSGAWARTRAPPRPSRASASHSSHEVFFALLMVQPKALVSALATLWPARTASSARRRPCVLMLAGFCESSMEPW